MSDKPHAWELSIEEKKKLLPSVKPEFYSSPHAWEVEEPTSIKRTERSDCISERQGQKHHTKREKKGNGPQKPKRDTKDNQSSISNRLGPKPSESVQQPDKQESFGSIFDRLGSKPVSKSERERVVTRQRSPSPSKKPQSQVRKKTLSPQKVRPPSPHKSSKNEALPTKVIENPKNANIPTKVELVPIDQLNDNIDDWADDTSPMDYSKIPVWN